MPRYDPETIAALAEGRLDSQEAAALEREIAADPVAAAELAAQRLALKTLAAAPPAELTAAERTELRSAIADAIGLAAPEPEVTPAPRTVPWGSLGIAAAALVALVAIVPVAGLLTTDGGDADTAELAAEAPATSKAAEGELRAAPATDEAVAEAPPVGAVELDDAAGQDATAEASAFGASTTAVPQSTTTAAAAPTTTSTASSTTTLGLDEETLAALAADLEAIKSDPEAVNALAAEAIEEDICWVEDTQIRGDPPPTRFRFEHEDGQITVVVYFELEEGVVGPFRVWGVPDCADLIVIP